RLERLPLAPISAAPDRDVDQAERELPGAFHLAPRPEEPGAGAEDGTARGVAFLGRPNARPLTPEVQHRRGLSTGHRRPSDLVAWTIALARLAGSLDLKMPEPTNTASAPSCIISAAAAGVAMPPAEKFGTGSLPAFAAHRTSS